MAEQRVALAAAAVVLGAGAADAADAADEAEEEKRRQKSTFF